MSWLVQADFTRDRTAVSTPNSVRYLAVPLSEITEAAQVLLS